MTISTTTNRWAYTGDGATVAFAYTNKIFDDSDLNVYVDGTLKTLTTDYTVSGAGVISGGNVTFGTAPASAAEVVIVRDVSATQATDFLDAGSFPAASTEDAVDKLTILAQQLEDSKDRSLRQPESDTTNIGTIPAKASRLGKLMQFNATTGDPEVVAAADLSLTTVSSYMDTLLGTASEAALKAAINLEIGTDVQAYDADLAAIAGLTRARGDLIRGGASAWENVALGTSGKILGSDGTDAAWADRKTLATPQATTSGTAFDFTGIPAWAKKITITFTGVSLSGSDAIIVQIGDAGGIETSGYLGSAGQGTTFANFTNAFGVINGGGAGSIHHGSMTLTLANASTNTWVASGTVGLSNAATVYVSGGSKPLSDTLTQVRVTRSGTDTFDAGEVNVVYE